MLILLLAAALLQVQPPTTGAAMTTLDRGDQSNVDNRRQVVVRTAAEWNTLWREHGADRQRPAVEFSRDMVVGVFLGSRPTAGFTIEIVGVRQTPGGLVVEYREKAPGRDMITAQVLTSPYHLVAVPKQAGEVKFEKVQ